MATITRSITNISPNTLTLFVPGYNKAHASVDVAPSITLDLFSVLTMDEVQAIQGQLADLVTLGSISVASVGDSATLVCSKDNATSLRVSGPSHTSENSGQVVQSYSGVFYNDSYDVNGLLKTRFITGGNEYMDLEIQSSNAILISAVGENAAGFAKIAARTNVIFNVRDEADQDSPKQLVIDRVDTSTVGAANTSAVVIKANSGSLHLNYGITDGAVGMPSLTTVEKDAIVSPVEGMIVYDVTLHKLCVFTAQVGGAGTGWETITSILE